MKAKPQVGTTITVLSHTAPLYSHRLILLSSCSLGRGCGAGSLSSLCNRTFTPGGHSHIQSLSLPYGPLWVSEVTSETAVLFSVLWAELGPMSGLSSSLI